MPRIEYRERKLGNGLTVLSVESHASPTVSIQVWYHVGGADDPEGKSGFAHLFEHMMFKGSKYMKSEQFDRLTEDVGGENNAFTSEDVTAYQAVVPSNHLETLLWAEAERLLNLQGRRGQLPLRARRGAGGVPAADPRLALRPLLRGDAHQAVPAPSLPARRDRQHREPRRRRGRRRRRLPRHLLPAGQRHPDRHRRLRPAPARRLGRQVLRARSPARPTPLPRARDPGAGVDRRPDDHGQGAERAAAGGGDGLAGAAGDRRRRAGAAGRRRLLAAGESSRLNQALVYSAADRDPGRASAPTCGPGPAS